MLPFIKKHLRFVDDEGEIFKRTVVFFFHFASMAKESVHWIY